LRQSEAEPNSFIIPLKIHVLVPLLILSVGTSLAEDVVLSKNTVMRVDRSLTSLKAGTTVEIIERGDKSITIRYKGQTGTIPLGSLAAKDLPATNPTKVAVTATTAATKAPKSIVVDNPQSTYGNLVKKAEINAAKHEDNLVTPANQVTDDIPSK
jgi:hypothetical protein